MNRKTASLDRRSFMASASAAALAASFQSTATEAADAPIPIIDTHIHLFDQHRPQGAPYSGPPNSPTFKTGSSPDGYKKLAAPMGVVGAIHVEASNWIEDNLWVLEACADNDFMLGAVGNINPEVPEFPEFLERFHRNPLLRGVRYGDLWGYDLIGK
jgi:L-fuconolactonase